MSEDPGYFESWSKPATGIRKLKEVDAGDMATQDSSAVAITGGTMASVACTDIAITSGSVLGATLAGKTQAITEAGAISIDANAVDITGPATSTYAVTLAAPTRAGQYMLVKMSGTTDTNAVTLALTNVAGGSASSSASFDAAGEYMVLLSCATKWNVVVEYGVTLS